MKHIIIIVLGFILTLGCKKVDVKEQAPLKIGDYEWYYSEDSFGTGYYSSSSEDKYGIRIKDNSKLFIFKNGSKIYKERITKIEEIDSVVYIEAGKENNKIKCEIQDFVLITSYLPFEGFTNEFKRIK